MACLRIVGNIYIQSIFCNGSLFHPRHELFLAKISDGALLQVLLHIRTEKGMGYPPAMAASDKYHGVAKFNVASGKQNKGVSFIFAQSNNATELRGRTGVWP